MSRDWNSTARFGSYARFARVRGVCNGGHLVQKFLECRINPDTHQWEVLVQWISLDVADNSWEPASILQEDVPKLFRRWVASEPKAEALRTFIHTESTRRRDK
ncbi:unnamed protein product [Albugo candida]|uniref:Chromo domain-containing protein n=1 Tax=Albugo candida TaxID=65357 RepID=A0A024FTG2_9STRA|nr:unnamed protein product [Albugo candida]|eukprot:CCI10398.1 unnamed protein product [Albugo candida]